MMTRIYHNNRCTKSRIALKELEETGEEFEVINYLENSLQVEELSSLIKMLGIKPLELVRTSEEIYKENFRGKELTDEEWVEAMHQNPTLIQRPIVVRNGKAVIARSDEAIDEILA